MVPRERQERLERIDGKWAIKKVIEIPAEPADPEKLPPLLQGFKAVAPLVTDINLSLDDRYLYVSCWGTGEFIQYDVTDPFKPKKVSSIRLGGIVSRAAHPEQAGAGAERRPADGRDQPRRQAHLLHQRPLHAVGRPVLSRRRPRLDGEGRVRPEGGMELDRRFFLESDGMRPHQVRLEGGDASSDSYCYA